MEFNKPTLLLENIENHLAKIKCYQSSVFLYFRSSDALDHAHMEFKDVKEFLLITSHGGCNEDGERDLHLSVHP